MLAVLSAAALAASPIPADYTLPEPELTEVAPGIWSDSPAPLPPSPNEYRAFRKGVTERRIAFHALNIADAALTMRCIDSPTCKEGNPLYGQSKTKVIAGKVLSAVVYEFVLNKAIQGADRQTAKRHQWSSIVLLSGVVAWNMTLDF